MRYVCGILTLVPEGTGLRVGEEGVQGYKEKRFSLGLQAELLYRAL
jgi:hypothetical protein